MEISANLPEADLKKKTSYWHHCSSRSSCGEVYLKTFLKNFAKFTGKHEDAEDLQRC